MNPNAWSTDPDSNDRIDPPIDWREGESPALVNDSGRGMMAAVASLLRDTTSTLTAAGTTAYTLTLNQTIAGYGSHFEVAFFVASANTGPATLSVNGLASKRILRRFNRELGPGDLTPFIIYRALYIGVFDAYIITSPEIAAPGKIDLQAGSDADPGWLPCDGRAVSRVAYAALLSRIGFTFGVGDGSTTFNLPDLRGRAPFGADAGAGRLSGAGGLGGGIGSTGGAETVALSVAQMPGHSHTGTAQAAGATDASTTGPAGDHNHGGQTDAAGKHGHPVTIDQGGSHNHTGSTATAGGEARKFSFAYGSANINAPGSSAQFVTDINVSGTFSNERQTSGDPGHSHGVTIDQGGAHGHTGTASAVDDHRHGIPGSGTHTHPLPAAAAHTHPLAIDNNGGGLAHSNVPPGLVVQFVIKA